MSEIQLPVDDAVDHWREVKRSELADATFETQTIQVEQFAAWLRANGYEDVAEVTASDVQAYQLSMAGEYAQSTIAQRVGTARKFIRLCGSLGAPGLVDVAEHIDLPPRSEPRDEKLDADAADAILTYCRRFEYASRRHALFALAWRAGLRSGTLVGLDVQDVDETNHRVRVRHRPETDTPLKNGPRAERYVSLTTHTIETLTDYVAHHRIDVTDEHDRDPLFTTENGRAPVRTLRRWFYGLTRPCVYAGACPHERVPQSCDAAQRLRDADECPSSRSGHPVRRGAITNLMREDVPERVVSDRADVSRQVLDEHYDRRSESEKAEQRRDYVDEVF